MRLLTARLIGSLFIGITVVSLFSSYFEVRFEERHQRADLERRAEVFGESLSENIEPHFERSTYGELRRIVERYANREHLLGIAIYNSHGDVIAITPGLVTSVSQPSQLIATVESSNQQAGQFTKLNGVNAGIFGGKPFPES
jgi:hypothetical protein